MMTCPMLVFTYADESGELKVVQGTFDGQLVLLLKTRDGEFLYTFWLIWCHLQVCFSQLFHERTAMYRS
jgi:hypothetical protein